MRSINRRQSIALHMRIINATKLSNVVRGNMKLQLSSHAIFSIVKHNGLITPLYFMHYERIPANKK